MTFRSYCSTGLTCLALMVGAGQVSANDNFDAASQELCEHLRQCTLDSMGKSDVDPNMRQMVEGMVQGMCKKMTRRFEVEGYEDIRDSAAACMRSMTEQDCDALDSATTTPACREYEEMAEKYNEKGSN